MHCAFLERSRTRVAMQAFPVVIWFIQLDVFRCRRFPKIVDVEMLQPPEFCFYTTEHGVIRMAGVASLVGRHAMILKMCGGQMPGIINLKASPVRLHDVA